ncbi:MAG: alpha/beta fold hydrolase, partial [bacterium]
MNAKKVRSITTELTHKHVLANGIRLHVVESGNPDGQPVIFLHGFPEFWYSWRYQFDAFADAGYHVIAPDQRGYNLSDKPKQIKAYNLDELAQDIAGLIDVYKHEKAFVVAHDWGGMAAWWMAMACPERIQKLVVMNVPHPRVMLRHLKTNPAQRRRSRYVFLFQFP